MIGTTPPKPSEGLEKQNEFIASARESAAHFQRTGIVYTIEDVERYVMAKAAGRKAAKPKPVKIPPARR